MTLTINYFIVFQLLNKKMSKLTKNQLYILSNHYSRTYDAWEAYGDIYDTLEKHENKVKYYIFRTLCHHKGRIIKDKNNRLVCIIKLKLNHMLLTELTRNCFINELLNSEYDNEILTKVFRL